MAENANEGEAIQADPQQPGVYQPVTGAAIIATGITETNTMI